MKICLAIGDRTCEDFLKSSIGVLLQCLNTKDLEGVAPEIEAIYNDPEKSKEEKQKLRIEILAKFFDGHQFLSNLSLTTLRAMKASNITEIEFVEEAPYREAVVDKCRGYNVDLLILSEMLQGQVDFQTLCQEVRINSGNTRILVIGGQHEKGDDFFVGLTAKAIYDIVYGESLQFADLFKLIFTKNTYSDSLKYLKTSQLSNPTGSPVVTKPVNYTASIPTTNPFEAAPTTEKKEKVSIVKKSKKEEPPAPVRHDTDLFGVEETETYSGGTELIEDTDTKRVLDGLIAYPYDLKPVVVTNLRTKEDTVINPDGSTDTSGNLPAVVKTIKDKNYELYVTSLMTDAGTENHGVMLERPTGSPSTPYGLKGKSLLFTSSVPGVGCSSVAFNLACFYAFANKKRVLFIDTCFGESSNFARLEFPQDVGATIEDVMQDFSQAKNILHKQMLVANAVGNNVNRFSLLPDTLSYMTWSRELNPVWLQDNISLFDEMIDKLSYQYDYIIYDSSLLITHIMHDSLLKNADYIIPVVTQDLYTTNKTSSVLRGYNHLNIGPKMRLIVNRYEKVSQLPLTSFSSDFFGATAYPVFDDNCGFISSNAQGIPYVLNRVASKRTIKCIRTFVAELG